jgi:hypothetical protein
MNGGLLVASIGNFQGLNRRGDYAMKEGKLLSFGTISFVNYAVFWHSDQNSSRIGSIFL